MRLRTLTMTAFGPFSGTETIAFDGLTAAKLFLVAGPTGAGKTTILDAICYALYGETTGEGQGTGAVDGRHAAELRSRGAKDDAVTSVALDFEVDGVRYRIERSPKQIRAAQRGGGTVAVLEKVKLFRGETLLAWKVGDATREVERITGFSADEFRRVVVIPQGRFRDVLVSESSAREDLLKRIFRTHRYERFEGLVRSRLNETTAAAAEIDQRRSILLAGEEWSNSLDPDAVQQELATRAAVAGLEADRCMKELAVAQVQRDAAVGALATAEESAKLFAALDDARRKVLEAERAIEALAPSRTELERAKHAAEPNRLLNTLAARRKALEDATAALPPLEEKHREAEAAFAAAEEAHARVAEAANELPALNEQIGALKEKLSRVADASRRRQQAEQAAEQAAAALAAATRDRDAAHARRAASVAAREAAEKNLLIAEARSRDGIAGSLARQLKAGIPCPVCGGCEHPSPAPQPPDVPTEAEVDALRSTFASARSVEQRDGTASAEADTRWAAAGAAAAAATAALGQEAMPPDAADLEADLAKKELRAKAIDAARRDCEERLGKARDARDRSRDELATARNQRQVAERERTDADTAFATALRASPFKSEPEVQGAARSQQQIATLEGALRVADDRLTELKGGRDRLEHQVAGRTRPVLEPLRDRQAAAVDAHHAAEKANSAASSAKERLDSLVKRHAECLRDGAEATRRLTVAEALDKMVTGHGAAERVSFHRWVLGAVLEEILAEATHILRSISGGRYELLRQAGGLDGRIAAGLDIEVFDSGDGSRRPARTLSGGETFMASLALALALARTTERRGGRRLDTLFIDEGFGSLDRDRLDLALGALQRLSAEGRVVGVISHVDEMHRAILAKLEVIPRSQESGSTTRVRGIE